ncbi:hypothetical protein BGP_2167 [Beggiatoa sp. PS]|nr:hypothetical protein BGP_2167 [Beggiatoa sp. PS]
MSWNEVYGSDKMDKKKPLDLCFGVFVQIRCTFLSESGFPKFENSDSDKWGQQAGR